MNRRTMLILTIILLLIFTVAIDGSSYLLPSLAAGPSYINLPIVIRQDTTLIDAPAGALAVFSSTATTNGNAGGRTEMNAICSAVDPEAHFCTLMEIENAFLYNGVFFVAPYSEAWVDRHYQLGSIIANTSDVRVTASDWMNQNCQGWATDITVERASVITENAVATTSLDCSATRPVSCCKWGP